MNGFDAFWRAYPRKIKKGDAEKAWKTVAPDAELQTRILLAIESARASRDWLKEEGNFIPYPATWLRAKGWEDIHTIEMPDTHQGKALLSDTARYNLATAQEAEHIIRERFAKKGAIDA